jgi:hypothetical protein
MNEQLRAISELNRVIHEPGRLMIVALLGGGEGMRLPLPAAREPR